MGKIDMNKVIKRTVNIPFDKLTEGMKKKKFVGWLICKHGLTIDKARLTCWRVFTSNTNYMVEADYYSQFSREMKSKEF